VTGRTVDAAKEAALDQLGVAEGDAEVIVVSEPKTGLFGRVRGEARVRARVRPVGPRPKRQRRSGRERTRGGRGSGGGRNGRSEGSRGSEGGGQPGERSAGRAGGGSAGDTTRDGGGRSRSSRRRQAGSGGRSGGSAGNGSAPAARSADGAVRGNGDKQRSEAEEETAMAEGMTLEEQAAVAKEFLEGLLDRYGFEATVETRVLDEETVELSATGDDLGLLVGPRGSTLAALQDVTRTVVQRRFPTRTDRILVDVARYRERRAAALQRFSQQVAAEVVEGGTERALEPMTPADRKVVHDTINEIEGVVTRSEGEDPGRYIVISPAE
jgi:spoIIIJ-associated protein